jgi:hypothetical protein
MTPKTIITASMIWLGLLVVFTHGYIGTVRDKIEKLTHGN